MRSASKGYFGIYIWTYNPRFARRVGQSTRKTASGKYSFYTRVSLYFNDNFLSNQLRPIKIFDFYCYRVLIMARALSISANKIKSMILFYIRASRVKLISTDISLTLLRIDPNQYGPRPIKLLLIKENR